MGKKNTRKKFPKKSRGHPASQRATGSKVRVSAEQPVAGAASVEDTEPRWGLYLAGLLIFIISTPAIVGPYGQAGGYSPDLHMAAYIQAGVLLVLFLFAVSTFFRQRVSIYHSPLLLPALLLYGWAMLSVLWANTKYEAVIDALDWSGAFFSALLVILLLRRATQIRALLFFLLISGLLMALLGIGQYLLGIDWVNQHIVPAATFANKNMAGQYGVLIFPIAVAFFLYTKNAAFAWVYAVAVALIMTCIFYTRARGAWVGFFFELAVLFVLLAYVRLKHDYRFFSDLPIKKVALAASMALFLGMSYLTSSMLGNQEKVLSASIGTKPLDLQAPTGLDVFASTIGNAGNSADKRFTIWANSTGMFRDHFLIGVGLGNWTIHYAKYQSLFKQDAELLRNKFHANAHNDYVEILCELGVIGFALFLWLVFALFKVMRGLLNCNDRQEFLFSACLMSALSGIALNAIFSFPFKQPIPIFIILVYMAALSNLYSMIPGRGKEHTLSLPSLPIKAVAAFVILAATVGIFLLHVNLYKSEVHYRYATVALERGEFERAYQEARRAYALNPMRTILLWLEATALMQLGRWESSEEIIGMFKRVERHYPYSSSALINLATVYNHVGRHDDAAASIERLISVQSGKEELKYAMFLLNAGRLQDSLKQLEEVVLPPRMAAYEVARERYARLQGAFDGHQSLLGGMGGDVERIQNGMESIRMLIDYIPLWFQPQTPGQKRALEAPSQ